MIDGELANLSFILTDLKESLWKFCGQNFKQYSRKLYIVCN